MTIPAPIRVGRRWLFADGTMLPVISGGSDADGADDAGTDAAGDDDGSSDAEGKQPPVVDHEKEAAKWKAMARRHEARAKENDEARRQLDELKNAGKSETEKLQALLDAERSKAKAASVKALKLQVAAEKGLDAKQAKFLPDLDDEVDMMQAADEILEAFGSTGKAGSPTRQPKSTLTNPLGDDDASATATREALINSMLGKAAI